MNRRLSIAPMMDWTDRHCRAFHRALTAEALLYTEMVTAPAVLHGDRQRLLGFDAVEHPVDEVTVAVVGKYIDHQDAYKSLSEALKHGGLRQRTKVTLKWIESEQVGFFERVRDAYHARAAQFPERIRLVASDVPMAQVREQILLALGDLLVPDNAV